MILWRGGKQHLSSTSDDRMYAAQGWLGWSVSGIFACDHSVHGCRKYASTPVEAASIAQSSVEYRGAGVKRTCDGPLERLKDRPNISRDGSNSVHLGFGLAFDALYLPLCLETASSLKKVGSTLGIYYGSSSFALLRGILFTTADFRKACANVHSFVEEYIDELGLHKQETPDEKAYGFITQIAQESAAKEDLRDQLLNVLLAGRDTTACCLSWTFRLLVRHPRVLKRLREEIASVIGNSQHPTRESVRKMPFLACVVKESLRLYPPVPLNNREAIKTTMLPVGGGPEGNNPILVRKGELVVFSQYVNSRKRNIYGQNAEEFHPERWEGDQLKNIGWAFFPFNGGPRQCLGEDFALMETYYTIIRLLQTFPHIRLPKDEPVEPIGTEKQRLTLVLSSADGCRVEIKSRKKGK